jgi:outer membrane lipoprotein carrier protein
VKVFSLLLMMVWACFAVADEPSSQKLQQLLTGMNTFEANFIQHNYDGRGSVLQTLEGKLQAKNPGQFRWQTKPPYQQLLVTNGKTLWLYDQDLEQVTVQPLDDRLVSTPALLLTGRLDELNNAYEVYGEQLQKEWNFVLTPKSKDVLFDRLRLEFSAKGKLSRMVIQDEVGQKTVLTFRDVKSNISLADSLFTFEPPAGVDVIQSAP